MAVRNVLDYYYKKAGLTDDMEFGFRKGVEGDGTIAETTSPPPLISFPLSYNNNTIYPLLNSDNNIMNIMVHEHYHAYGEESSAGSNKVRHLNAYYAQTQHSSWEGTTKEFKSAILNAIGNFLDNGKGTDKEKSSFREKFENVYGGKIEYNSKNKAYEIVKKK